MDSLVCWIGHHRPPSSSSTHNKGEKGEKVIKRGEGGQKLRDYYEPLQIMHEWKFKEPKQIGLS